MPVSQFKIYSSSDRNAPTLMGQSGSLVTLLDACLVYGYGDKSPVGWTKPLPNDPFTSSIGCWQMPSGSQRILHVVDTALSWSGGGNVQSSGAREAWATGYDYLYGLTGSVNGSGSGQFPPQNFWPAQAIYNGILGSIASGSFVWRKSAALDTLPRDWIMFADAHTMYLFVKPGESVLVWSSYIFGDIFSLASGIDNYKCLIQGRFGSSAVIGAASNGAEPGDLLLSPGEARWPMVLRGALSGVPIIVQKSGDTGKFSYTSVNSFVGNGVSLQGVMYGFVPSLNPSDNSLYLSPIWIMETSNQALRGRIRGMWMLSHTYTEFTDGQIIYGANEQVGKVFQIVKYGAFGGMFVMEISNTVETNE